MQSAAPSGANSPSWSSRGPEVDDGAWPDAEALASVGNYVVQVRWCIGAVAGQDQLGAKDLDQLAIYTDAKDLCMYGTCAGGLERDAVARCSCEGSWTQCWDGARDGEPHLDDKAENRTPVPASIWVGGRSGPSEKECRGGMGGKVRREPVSDAQAGEGELWY